MKNLDRDLNGLYEKVVLKEKIEVHIEGIEAKLKDRLNELEELDAKVIASENNLEELEKMNIRNLFATILKNKEQQFERERQNYLLCFLERKECIERIKAKEFEIKVLKEKLLQFRGVDAQFEKLVKDKKQRLKFKHRELAKDIILIESNIRKSEAMKKEITEAVNKGEEVLIHLGNLKSSLFTMGSWKLTTDRRNQDSTHIYSSYKHKKFSKELLTFVRKVNTSLDDFLDELSDVSKQYELNYDLFIERVSNFLRNFYDGLISDWIYHEELQISNNLVQETLDKIKRIIAMLAYDFKMVDHQLTLDHQELNTIVMNNEL